MSSVGARTQAMKLALAGYLRTEALISTIVGLLILCSKNGSVGIYGTFKILIHGRAPITYVNSAGTQVYYVGE